MKMLAPLILCLLPFAAFAEPDVYEASIEVRVSDARSVLSSLNKRLNLKLDEKDFADYAESLRAGHVYSVDFDMHFDGTVFTATYQIAKADADRVELSFSSFQKPATTAICREMARLGKMRDAKHSPESCDYERPEEYEI